MIRIREKNCQIEVGSGNELFCTFDLYWRNSKEELLHPDDRCIDVMVNEVINTNDNSRSLMIMNFDGTPITLKSFHASLKDNGVQLCPNYRIFYRDDENDDIPIDSDWEYEEALKLLLSRNENTKANVMMIIEGEIQKTKNGLEEKKTAQLKAPTSIATASKASSSEAIDSAKNSHPKNDSKPKRRKINSSKNRTTKAASDSPQRDEAFNMLQNYLENFKKEIVNDVVKIVEKKLLSAFGNVSNDNNALNHENPIHEPPIQENPRYEELNTRFRRMRDEMQKYNCPRTDDRNIRPRPFSVPFPRPPMFPAPGTNFRPLNNPPPFPPYQSPNSFEPFMNSSDFAKYVSLLAQGAASSHLASNMFPKCNNNLKKNDTQKPKVQKKNIADNTEAMEVSENIDENSTDSSSFEILSTNSSPTNIDDDNSSPVKRKYKTVDTYDCTSDEESGTICHENTRNPTFIVQSCNTSQKQKPKEKIPSELEKRSGGSYSFVSGTLLPTSSNGINGTDATVGNNGNGTRSSVNNKNSDTSPINNNQSSANREASNGTNFNRSFGMNSHMNTNRYANLYTNGNSTLINGSLQNKRNELMNSYHNLLHNERDYRRQYSRPMTAPSQFSNGDDSFWNPRFPDEYLSYGMDDYYRRFNVPNSSWVDPFLMNPVITGAYDAAQQALSVAHEVMEKTSKSPGSKM